MSNVIPFQYKEQEVRVVEDNQGNPWWVAKDVCDVLGLSNPTMALERLDEDERSKLSLGRQGETNCINGGRAVSRRTRIETPFSGPKAPTRGGAGEQYPEEQGLKLGPMVNGGEITITVNPRWHGTMVYCIQDPQEADCS